MVILQIFTGNSKNAGVYMSSFSLPLDRCAIAIAFGGDLPFGGVDDLREEKKICHLRMEQKKHFLLKKMFL